MLIHEVLEKASVMLGESGLENPELDAGLLLGHCLNKSRTALYLKAQEELDSENEKKFLNLLRRRQKREPLAYIFGLQEFWSLDFQVSPNVLIPRPETELLLERALAVWRERSEPGGLILDLCTGSGAIAIVLARELGQPVIAVDISMAALRIAKINAQRHGVAHLISFVQSDLLSAFSAVPRFSLVLSNPPYVSVQELEAGLQPEVALYEPHLALDGGDKGLEVIKKIHSQLVGMLLPEATLLIEIGAEQGNELLSLFSAKGSGSQNFSQIQVEKDYSNQDRIFYGKVKAENLVKS